MNKTMLLLLLSILVVPHAGAQAEFVQDAGDNLAADTMDMVISVAPDAGSGLFNVQLDLYLFNDGNNLIAMAGGYAWDNPHLRMDSAVLSPLASSAFNFATFCYDKNTLDTTNHYRRFPFVGLSMTWPYLAPQAERNLLVSYYFTVDEWSANDTIVFDTMTYSAGTILVLSSGRGAGALGDYSEHKPMWTGPKVVYDTPSQTCCVQRVGDADGLNGDEPTIGDLTVMIDAKFISGYCDGIIACLAEADINLSGGADPTCDDITMGDIAILQDYLFITGSSLGLDDCF
ncbi:MAG: hypothetical protein J7J98_02085 [candidate division Zixibacteria bacterium]|nr:hypothetical protein [candidate division Zixibacteria bacterium]